MRAILLGAASLVLAWQAALGAADLWSAARARSSTSWRTRLAASTDERIERVLGGQMATLVGLRELAPHSLLLCQKVEGRLEDIKTPAEFERLNARNGLLVQLTHLLYPDPALLPVSTPIDTVEAQVRLGNAVSLCVLPGDPAPGARRGWTRTHDTPRFQLWQFRTE